MDKNKHFKRQEPQCQMSFGTFWYLSWRWVQEIAKNHLRMRLFSKLYKLLWALPTHRQLSFRNSHLSITEITNKSASQLAMCFCGTIIDISSHNVCSFPYQTYFFPCYPFLVFYPLHSCYDLLRCMCSPHAWVHVLYINSLMFSFYI